MPPRCRPSWASPTLLSLLIATSAYGVDRLVVAPAEVPLHAEAGCALIASLDAPVVAFSLSARFDPTKLEVRAVEPGSALASLGVEYFDGRVDAGRLSYGVLLDLTPSSPETSRRIPAGAGRELLVLTLGALGSEEATTELRLENIEATANSPPRVNVFTRPDGQSVRPVLAGGTVELVDRAPRITSLEDNRGRPGQRFLVRGVHLSSPGLGVEVCEHAAELQVLAPDLVEVTAPVCALSESWAPLRLTTDYGEDMALEGFFYEEDSGRFLRGDANDDGRLDLSDGVSIFSDLFLGSMASAPCRDALDANDSSLIDISDGIYLLNSLFLGGSPPPPPWPEPGVDPTPDDLPDCVEG